MRIAIVTDAWHPQINGVVTTLEHTVSQLRKLGHRVKVISPEGFRTVACPGYSSIRLAIGARRGVAHRLRDLRLDAVHIATEGPLGLAARRYCLRQRIPFTTSLHTRFPEYLHARWRIPVSLGYAWLRWFHRPARRVMVSTPRLLAELRELGFPRVALWPRGVDTDLFHPARRRSPGRSEPVCIYVGRIAVEKNLEAFLDLDLPYPRVVVGDGPELGRLRKRYPNVEFTGTLTGEALARTLASADVFVFPSRTDTFGLVMLEAMAAGLPVAAFPVPGPVDVIRQGVTGCCDEDLGLAIHRCMGLSPTDCRRQALASNWQQATLAFLHNISAARRGERRRERAPSRSVALSR
jgi:glycosyltransferase involved in cell wall biosynthesis